MRMFDFGSQYQPGETPYEIFKDRMGAIGSIVEGIKGIIENKYNKGFIDTYLGQVNKAISAQQATDIISMATSDPGEEIYPGGIEKIEETAAKFVDTFNMMGSFLAKKESTMGGQLSMKGIPPTTGTPTSEVMLPKGDKSQLLNAIMNMPEGQMDFAPVLKYMEEHRPKFMGSFSPMEQFALSQAMGQPSPRDKMVKDIQAADMVSKYFAEPGEEKVNSEIALFQKSPEQYVEYIKLKNSLIGEKKTAWETEAETLFKWYKDNIITVDEFKKGMGIYIPPGKKSDFDKKFALASQMNLSINEWKKFFGVYLGEDEEGTKVQYYKTAEECIANADKIEGMTVDPTLDKTKGWYPNYVKKTKDDPNNYLFGKKDVYGNISRMGIIPYDAQMSLSYGQPLTEEQITQIKNNHNLQKSLLDEKMLIKVEAILKQIGIDFNETPEPTPEPVPEPDPAKFWESWTAPKMQPIWGLDEAVENIPTQKTQEKDYSAMTEDELKTAVLAGDLLAIEEAKKRGFLK